MPDTALENDDLPTRITALIEHELRAALEALAPEVVSDQEVHNARKSLKKARAGLRLHRSAMADQTFREQNLMLRDAGRLLSPLRDGHSQLQLFHSLDHEPSLPGERIEAVLQADLSQARHVFDTTNARERCTGLIDRVRAAHGADPFGADACIDGLRDVYRKGRRAFTKIRKKDSAARRHELRKQAKYLRVALEVIDAPAYRHAQDRARRVASWLGEDHDLAVLRERIERTGDGSQKTDARWIHRIEERQENLQRKAFAQAEKLFAEKPKAFVANLQNAAAN